MPAYAAQLPKKDPNWKVRFYSFEIDSAAKIEEKRNYVLPNPVRAGLVQLPPEWRRSSTRWYIEGRTVGLPPQRVECE